MVPHHKKTLTQETNTNPDSRELALGLAQIIDERQGTDIRILEVAKTLVIADYFLIASCRNLRQAQGLARELDATIKHKGLLRRNLAGVDGKSGWILLDFDLVVVHIFTQETRDFYSLDALWADAPQVEFIPSQDPAQ